MSGPTVQLACVGNVFTRAMFFEKAGDIEEGHAHPFDHATLLSTGSIRLTVEGCAIDFTAPNLIFIEKGKRHQLVALEDKTVVTCIHALRDEAGEILPESTMLSPSEYIKRTELLRHKDNNEIATPDMGPD